jgi:hypothetical protein
MHTLAYNVGKSIQRDSASTQRVELVSKEFAIHANPHLAFTICGAMPYLNRSGPALKRGPSRNINPMSGSIGTGYGGFGRALKPPLPAMSYTHENQASG